MLLSLSASLASAATYYVDGANSSATDSGPGSSTRPYKTLQAAVTAFGVPGNTITVRPATYREQVNVTVSGTSSNAIVIAAAGSGAVVSGSDDMSGTSRWSALSSNVYLATSVTWMPLQVFSDGTRLAPSAVAPASLPANSFVFVNGSGLYVNVGGGNPGNRKLEVGRRVHGFRVTGSYVTVNGFQVLHAEDDGVNVSAATASTIQNCRVSFCNLQGIQIDGGTSVLASGNIVSDNNDHGIFVTNSTSCRIALNESFRNVRPALRAANGIYVNASTSCTVEGNDCHDNQDSGIQFYNGANNCTSRNNLSWNNGDHGYDHVRSSGMRHSNDVAYGNLRDGFSFEGASPNASLFNCIAVDNGITTNQYDLWVDSTSTAGFQSDDNIIWNSTSQVPIRFIVTRYSTVSSYSSASGRDTRSIQSNPRFVNPAFGDFTLSPGSPAIDNANASAPVWPSRDAAGGSRSDDPGTPNTGIGSPPYSDRGAFEFTGAPTTDHAPVVTAPGTAIATRGVQLSLNVTAADSDGDAITALTANLSGLPAGNNAVFTANASKTAGTLTWTAQPTTPAGPFTVTFTATNALSGSAATSITVRNPDRPPIVAALGTATVNESSYLTLNVVASDPDGEAITSLTANFANLPAGNNAVFTPNVSNTAGTLTWTPTFSDARALPYSVTITAANLLSGVANTLITVTNVDRAPVVSAPATATASQSVPYTLNVTAADPDGDAVASLTADLSGLPSGNNAVFSSNAARTAGTLTWTPQPADGAGPYTVRFTAANVLIATASTALRIDRPPVVSAPATASVNEAALMSVNVTATDPDGDALTALTADLSRLPAGNNAVFTPNATRTAGTLTWTPSYADAEPGLYPVTFTVSNSLGASIGTVITVNNVDRGPTVAAPATFPAVEGVRTSIIVSATDPDGDALTSLTADLSGLPAGNDAVFTPNASNTAGTLTWTPTYIDGRIVAYSVTFQAANVLARSASSGIAVRDVPPPGTELVANQGFEGGVTGWSVVGRATLARVTTGHSGSYAAQMSATTGNKNAFGITDAPNSVDYVPTAGATYRISAWVRSASDVGTARLRVSELLGGSQQGAAVLSSGTRLNGAWTLETFDYVTRAAGSILDVEVVNFPSSGHESFQIDDVSIKQLAGGPADRPPVVLAPATVSVAEGSPMTVNITASDPDGQSIASLTADLSGLPAVSNAVFTVNAAKTAGTLTWTPTIADGRGAPYLVVFTAANAQSSAASSVITVTQSDRAPVITAPANVSATPDVQLTLGITAADPDGDAIASLTANLSALPAGHNAVFTSNASRTAGSLTWTPRTTDGAGPYAVIFTATNALSGARTTAITLNSTVDRPPVVTAPATVTVSEGGALSVNVSVTDPDGQPITSLTANLAALPAGNNATFTPNASQSAGTLTWTPATADGRAAPYGVTFTAVNALSGSASTAITVQDIPGDQNLVSNSGFETDLAGWIDVGDATLTRVAPGHSGGWCVQVRTSALGTFGIGDNPNLIPNVLSAGMTYRLSAWVRSSSSTGAARIKVKEYVGATQQGTSMYSPPVPLAAIWQQVSMDYVTRTAGSFLEVEINDYPIATAETIEIDDVIFTLVSGAPLRTADAETGSGQLPDFAARVATQSGGAVELRFSTRTSGPVRIQVFDVGGRRVGQPLHAFVSAGEHRVALHGDGTPRLGAGVYFYRLDAVDGTRKGRFALVY